MRKIDIQEARELAFKIMRRAELGRLEAAEKEANEYIEDERDDLPYDLFIVDGYIEPNIAPVVEELREKGFDTFTSCDGGEGHSFQFPIVKISHRNWFHKDENNPYCIYKPKEYSTLEEFDPYPVELLKQVYDFIVEKEYLATVILNLSPAISDFIDKKMYINSTIEIIFEYGKIRRRFGDR